MKPVDGGGGRPIRRVKRKTSWKILWREERYTVLLASIFIYTLLSALLPQNTCGAALLDFIFLVLVISVVFEAARFRSIFSIFGLLGLLALLGHGVSYLWGGKSQGQVILSISSILFILAAIIQVSKRVLGSKVVTGDTIRGAIIIYLLIGALFTSVFILIEIAIPGSYLITNSAGRPTGCAIDKVSKLFSYYSMVTLTTLGYGDIVPVKELSRTTAWVEAFIGQIYLAVIIARLVGIYIAQSVKKSL